MPLVYMDIETLPAEESKRAEIEAELRAAGYTPPGNVSKAETIAAKAAEWEAGLPAQAEAIWRKTGLDAAKGGRVLCIGYYIEAGTRTAGTSGVLYSPWVTADPPAHPAQPGAGIQTFATEADLLRAWYDLLKGAEDATAMDLVGTEKVEFCGHNLLDFDLPYIWRRSVMLGVRPSVVIDPRRYSQSPVYDTMHEWSRWNKEQTCSLDALCRALGVESSKGQGIDGSQVYDAWARGEHQRIADYCLRDVLATRECHRRIEFLDVPAAPPAAAADDTGDEQGTVGRLRPAAQ